MRPTPLLACLLTASCMLVAAPSHAGIVSVSGAALQMAAPGSVVPNMGNENSTRAAVFAEQQNVLLQQNLQVDTTTAGAFGTLASLTPGSISAGTSVSSFYLHADPVGSSNTVYAYIGSIVFDSDILGVAALNAQLLTSNFLGAPGTVYPGASTVNGVELTDNTDSFTVSADHRTLGFRFFATGGADALRVVTQGAVTAVPEPDALALAGTALAALAWTRRRPARTPLTTAVAAS